MTRFRLKKKSSRRGTSMVEMAIVLPVFLVLVFGMLDLAAGVFRYNMLAQAARQGVRQAIVHGSLADRLGPWGPAAYSSTGADGHAIADVVRPSLATLDPAEVTLETEWLDGNNELNQPVRVTVSAPYQPMMTFIFGNPSITLRATSTMPIAH